MSLGLSAQGCEDANRSSLPGNASPLTFCTTTFDAARCTGLPNRCLRRVTEWQMLGNGLDPTLTVNGGGPVGDCTFAGRHISAWPRRRPPEGPRPGNPPTSWSRSISRTDQGADRGANSEVLMIWFLSGKIRAFAPVDHTDPVACDTIMAAFTGSMSVST